MSKAEMSPPLQPKPSRRWLRFSLRTMFIVVTVICCWLGWESSIVRGRQALLKELRTRPAVQITTAKEWLSWHPDDAPVAPRASVPLVRGWLGDDAIQEITYSPHVQPLSTAERSRVARVFPEAQVREMEQPLEPCHPGCFPRGTLVDSPQGPRLIETIRPGDVLTTRGPRGEVLTATVQSVFVTNNILWQVETEAGSLLTTKIQPLCLAGGEIQAAGKLQPGDMILHRQGDVIRSVRVLKVSSTERTEQVFNVVLGDSEIFVAGGFLARSKPPPEIAAK